MRFGMSRRWQRRFVAIGRWFVLGAQMSEKVPDLQVPRCRGGGLMPVCCGRAVQTSEQTFAGPGQPVKLCQGELPVALGSDHRCTLFEDSGLFFVHHYTLISQYFIYKSNSYDL